MVLKEVASIIGQVLSVRRIFDPTFASPILRRGTEFIYNPVKDILERLFTEGQSDKLNLTPDTIPPVFNSVSTTPVTVRNGDTLEISADLGETHLFVKSEYQNWIQPKPINCPHGRRRWHLHEANNY